jgi:copper homeostasis protein
MQKTPLVEVCADSLKSALIAQSAGADRVELCTNLAEGGTTPSIGLIEMVRKHLFIQVFVLIRPRGGDFLYTNLEFEIMKNDVHTCGKIGCDGVVVGMLNSDGTVDMPRNRELVNIAKTYSMSVTFHRAFDHCVDLFQSLEDVINLGCERILTSGGKAKAIDGVPILAELIQKSNGRIFIMPGAGITPENAAEILGKTGTSEIHGTLRSQCPSEMTYKNPNFINEYDSFFADPQKIEKIKRLPQN